MNNYSDDNEKDNENKEEFEYKIKARVIEKDCTGCGSCVAVCPTEAITMNEDNIAVVNEDLCIGCGSCVGVCPTEAMVLVNLDDEDKENSKLDDKGEDNSKLDDKCEENSKK